MLPDQELNSLAGAALDARTRAYAPYSHFHVGAALLTGDGQVFTGCNIENISYPAGLCAERVAIFSAVAAGCRDFRALAVAGGPEGEAPKDFCMPCGMCRQVMSEFCPPDFEVYVVKNMNEIECFHLQELLPHAFDSLKS